MQLTCPQCSTHIPAENINIQQMMAVCPECNTVFEFASPRSQKSKIRKVKQPQKISVEDTNDLEMSFRTNFRLDRNEGFLVGSIMSLMLTFVTIIITADMIDDGNLLLPIPIGFGFFTLALYYWLATIVFNKTHIEMDDEAITVTRKPLPNPLHAQPHMVNLNGVDAIRCGETENSQKEKYDTPRFRVWAEMADGRQKTIINDLTEDYAFFVTQRLQERLEEYTSSDIDVSRISDSYQNNDDAHNVFDVTEVSSQTHQR